MADVNYIITIDDRDALKALSDMKVGFNSVGTAATKAQQSTNTATDKMGKKVNDVDRKFKNASSSGLSFWKIVGGSALGGAALQTMNKLVDLTSQAGKAAITSAANYEKFRTTFKVFLGSTEEANRALDVLTKFTSESLFSQEDVFNAGKRLLALKVPVEELDSKLRAFGDISAGTGRAIDELVTIFAKVQNQGRVQGDEMLQIAEAGIPIYDVLIKQLGITRVELNKMQEEGKITADIFNKAFLSMGEKGGLFFGLVNAQSETFFGQVQKLKTEFEKFGREIAEDALPALKEIVTAMREFLESLDTEQLKIFFVTIKDTLYPALKQLYETIKDVTSSLTDINGGSIAENILTIVDAVTLLIRGIDFIIDSTPGLKILFTLIGDVAQGLAYLIQDLAFLTGGSSVDAYRKNIQNAAKDLDTYEKAENAVINANNMAKTAAYNLLLANGLLNKETKKSTELTIEDEKAKQRAIKALNDLENAYEQLRIKVRDSNTAQLEGFELIKAENKNALEDIDKLQKQLEKLAKAAGKTLSQEAKNGLNELRQNINENTANDVSEYVSQIIGNSIKSSGEIFANQQKQQQEGIDNLKDGINKYFDFLEEDELRRVDLINESTDKTLSLEEYQERERLEIRIRGAKRRLKQLENDTTTEGAALRISIQTTLDLAENELANFTPKTKDKDNFLVRFLKDQFGITSEEAEAIINSLNTSISYIYNAFAQSVADATQAEIDRNQKLIDSLNERVEKTKAALDEEYANQAKGSTNILQLKQTEYDKLKIQQEQATAQAEILRKKQLKQQLNAETLSQASSLLTSSANIIQSYSSLPYGVGAALSAVAIGAMFAAFAANRIKAYELARESAFTGGPMTQFLNGKSDRDGQRAYVVVDSDGKSVLNLGGNETIMNPSASSTYKGELAAMNKGVYKHRGVGEVAETRALSIGQKQTEIVQMREQMNYEEMKRVFGEVMIGYHEDYKKYNDKKEVFIPTKDGYISKKGLHTKKVRI